MNAQYLIMKPYNCIWKNEGWCEAGRHRINWYLH